jgi:hypothetical protein
MPFVLSEKDTRTQSNHKYIMNCILGRIYGAPAVFGTLDDYTTPGKVLSSTFPGKVITNCFGKVRRKRGT